MKCMNVILKYIDNVFMPFILLLVSEAFDLCRTIFVSDLRRNYSVEYLIHSLLHSYKNVVWIHDHSDRIKLN